MNAALIDMVLLTVLAITTVGMIRLRNLFGVVMLSAVYSFVMASVMMVLDAPDVAMTEAAVGAGISTVLMLSVLYLTKMEQSKSNKSSVLPLIICTLMFGMLLYGTYDLPAFGDPTQPSQVHVGPDYLQRSVPETGIVNVVTSVLASYRSFDTLGETTVVFTAGIAVLMLLKRKKKRSGSDKEERSA